MNGDSVIRLRADVCLRPLSMEHASNMYRWMCDPTIHDNIGLRSQPSLDKTMSWITRALQDGAMTCPFAIVVGHQHVGNVILDRIDDYLATARLSIYIGEPSARGSHVGRTALYLALSHAFEDKNLHKVWLTVHCRNHAAINAYTALGFVVEGVLRDEFWLRGQRASVLYMGLLRDDFAALAVERCDGQEVDA